MKIVWNYTMRYKSWQGCHMTNLHSSGVWSQLLAQGNLQQVPIWEEKKTALGSYEGQQTPVQVVLVPVASASVLISTFSAARGSLGNRRERGQALGWKTYRREPLPFSHVGFRPERGKEEALILRKILTYDLRGNGYFNYWQSYSEY